MINEVESEVKKNLLRKRFFYDILIMLWLYPGIAATTETRINSIVFTFADLRSMLMAPDRFCCRGK